MFVCGVLDVYKGVFGFFSGFRASDLACSARGCVVLIFEGASVHSRLRASA